MTLDSFFINQGHKIQFYILVRLLIKACPYNRFYWELVPGPRRAKLRIECLFDRSIADDFGDFFWEVNHLEITLKLSSNLSKKRLFRCSFLEFCSFAWIMQFLTNYAKSCDLRSIMQKRNIAEYQKPWLLVYLQGKDIIYVIKKQGPTILPVGTKRW